MTISCPDRSDVHGGDRRVDICVVGAGPAGLSAAVAAADAGVTVAVVDAEPGVGGQFWRQPAAASGSDAITEDEVAPFHHQLRGFRKLRQRLERHLDTGSVIHLAMHEVWAASRIEPAVGTDPASHDSGQPAARFELHMVSGSGDDRHRCSVRARSVVIATGAYDLQIPFPGWDLPGVMTAGGVQSLLKGSNVLAGQRIVVAGTGPFLLSVASGLVRSGATVPVVAEAASTAAWARQPRGVLAAGGKVFEGAVYGVELFRRNVSYRTGWSIVRASGDDKVRSVTLAPLTAGGNVDVDKSRTVPVDVLAVGWGFVPQLELAVALGCECRAGAHGIPVAVADANQRSTVKGVYLAGEVCGVGGAALAAVEGEIAGIAAAQRVNEHVTEDAAAEHLAEQVVSRNRIHLTRRRASLRAFADAMARVYPVPSGWQEQLPDDTIVCRCEEVTAGEIRDAARRDDAGDARSAKLLVRAGMGWCQGRVCGYATECVAAGAVRRPVDHRPPERPVAAPIPLGLVARAGSGAGPGADSGAGPARDRLG